MEKKEEIFWYDWDGIYGDQTILWTKKDIELYANDCDCGPDEIYKTLALLSIEGDRGTWSAQTNNANKRAHGTVLINWQTMTAEAID